MILAIAAFICWWVAGMLGFRFWWTTSYPIQEAPMEARIMTGLLGPFAWIIGYFIHR